MIATTPHSEEQLAIRTVLKTYYTAVTNRDEPAFLTTLLDKHIAFFSVANAHDLDADLSSAKMHNYASFSQGIFHSDERYTQTFDSIEIAQQGAIASVSLHFVTQRLVSGGKTEGWKILQLVKVDGHWKIASELYTAHRNPA